jgi:hypothetical protein
VRAAVPEGAARLLHNSWRIRHPLLSLTCALKFAIYICKYAFYLH